MYSHVFSKNRLATFFVTIVFHRISSTSPQRVSCLQGEESAVFLSSENYGLAEETVTTKFGLTQDQCTFECLYLDDCSSFEYTSDGHCRLNSNGVQKGLQLLDAPGVTYFQKICLSSQVSPCGQLFPREPQKLLLGYAQAVYSAPSMSACLAKCLRTVKPEADFTCASLHYYHRDQQCILNSETKTNFPDLFIPESVNADEVDYVENNCLAQLSQWSAWSPCRSPGFQIRFRNCSIHGACGNDTTSQMQSCVFGQEAQTTTEEPIAPVISTDPPNVPSPTDPALPGTTTSAVESGCTSDYCKGGTLNPCQDYGKLGYGSYGDCLRGHFSRNQQ